MIKRSTLFILCVFSLCCCNSKKSVQKTTDTTNTRDMQNQAAFEVSAQTKVFQSELKKVMTANELGQLPADFVKKYNLQKMDNQYYVGGFIQTTEDWKPESLTELGIKTGAAAGKMQTVSIPLDRFAPFLELSGISYFQLSESANPKK